MTTPHDHHRPAGHAPAGDAHSNHAHDAAQAPASWATAAAATRHCLTGCAIGEVLGMVIGTALGLHNAATVVLSIALAFLFGYGLTIRIVRRSGLALGAAIGVALAADTVSITVMEIVDNLVVVSVPGAMDAGLTSLLFWGSLAVSLLVAFVVTTPVNKVLISRGLTRDHVLFELGNRTAEQALADGEPERTVWFALCDALDVPQERRWGREDQPGARRRVR
jgi:hypothetical protein